MKTMIKKIVVISSCFVSCAFAQQDCGESNIVTVPNNATLLYSDSFHDTEISFYQDATNHRAKLVDSNGNAWPIDGTPVPGISRKETNFNYLISNQSVLDQYIDHAIVDAYDLPWTTNAVPVQKMKVLADDAANSAITRIQYNWWPVESLTDLYFEYYIKLDQTVMPDIGEPQWRSLFELKEKPSLDATEAGTHHHRAELMINREPDGNGAHPLKWKGRVELISDQTPRPYTGLCYNDNIAIPEGEWFLLTIHFKLDDVDGIFEASIRRTKPGGFDGPHQTLFSMNGIQTAVEPTNVINFVNFYKAYASENALPIEQYISNIKIHALYE